MAFPNLKTVKQFAEQQTVFTESALRNLIFYANSNGLAEHKAIKRVGGKILIDVDNFTAWLESAPQRKGK